MAVHPVRLKLRVPQGTDPEGNTLWAEPGDTVVIQDDEQLQAYRDANLVTEELDHAIVWSKTGSDIEGIPANRVEGREILRFVSAKAATAMGAKLAAYTPAKEDEG